MQTVVHSAEYLAYPDKTENDFMAINTICIFCGSSHGATSAFAAATEQLGHVLAARGIDVVYGGGNVGLMGVLADSVLKAGGRITGVIPHALVARELAHQGLTSLHVVDSMHERKALMADLAGGFIALPGGFGTLEEFAEAVTWTQLGLHAKPCGLLNVAGFYDGLLAFLAHALQQEFLRPTHSQIVVADADPGALIDRLAAWSPPDVTRWIAKGEQ
jgi:uncharacterized protein (TIGR00730 family)